MTAARFLAILVALTAALGAAGCGRVRDERHPAGARPVVDARAVADRFGGIPQGGTTLGAPSARLTMLEFGDLQCPFCRRFARDVLPALVRRYVRPGILRIDFRPVALLGPDSRRAARAALAAARQNRLWQFVDLFYANQGTENTGYVTDPFLRAVAGNVDGLDPARLLRTREDAPIDTQLGENMALARRVGIPGTPTFLLGRTGGRMARLVVPALEPAPFVAIVDRLRRQH